MNTFLAAVSLAALVAAPGAGFAAASPAPDVAVTIHIKDDAFSPRTVEVHPNDRVAFVNDDDDAHTATADDGSWDSEGLARGDRWTHAFMQPGRIAYHCTVHPMMHGTIVVTTR
jgi:plastocyanin